MLFTLVQVHFCKDGENGKSGRENGVKGIIKWLGEDLFE